MPTTRKRSGATGCRVALFAGLISFATSTAAYSQQSSNSVWAFGRANSSCGEFVQVVESERRNRPANALPKAVYDMKYASFLNYVDGYLTALNMEAVPPNRMAGEHSDDASISLWLENYCRANPLDVFMNATAKLRDALQAGRK